MDSYCLEIEFASPLFDESFRLRNELLRKPLNLEFRLEDIVEEYKEFHFGICSPTDELLGTLTFRPLNEKTLKMRQVAISKEFQGKKLGKTLVLYAEEWARAQGFQKIELAARVPVVSFYKVLGYKTVGEEFEEVGIPHQKMEKELTGEMKVRG